MLSQPIIARLPAHHVLSLAPLAGMRESVLQAGTYTSSSFRAVNASFWWRRHRFAASFFVLVCFFCVCGLKRQLPQHFNLPAHRLIKLVIDLPTCKRVGSFTTNRHRHDVSRRGPRGPTPREPLTGCTEASGNWGSLRAKCNFQEQEHLV